MGEAKKKQELGISPREKNSDFKKSERNIYWDLVSI